MLMRPRHVIYRHVHKYRQVQSARRVTSLVYGSTAALITHFLLLTARFMARLILFLKHITKRREKTKRRFWIRTFNGIPLRRKSLGLRMGKGVGKFMIYAASLCPNTVLVELRNVRPGRLIWCARQLNVRLLGGVRLRYSTLARTTPSAPPTFYL